MTDHESNDALTVGALIGIAGLIVAAALAVVLLTVRLLRAMEAELARVNAVVDGVGFP